MEKTKNCWVIPTDKPSMLQLQMNGNLHIENGQSIALRSYQNIYITSDEEIKGFENNIWVIKANRLFLWQNTMALVSNNKPQKIILTDNQDLIKDGIQEIDNKFLEWFVKNPSCEEVEINHERVLWEDGKITHYTYKIIIPEEELKTECYCEKTLWCDCKPKQEPILKCDICNMYPRLEGTNKCESCYSVVRHFLEQAPELKEHLLPDLRKKQETSSVGAENQIFKIVLDEKWRPNKVSIIEADNNSVLNKQETLEEAAERLTKDFPHYSVRGNMDDSDIKGWFLEALQKGAKWQAEKMYSEEEVGELLYNVIGEYGKHYGIMIDGKMLNDLFEQFKKK